jgi:hypothetical protein
MGMAFLSRFRPDTSARPPVLGVDAPPPRLTLGAALLVAVLLSGLWVAAVTLVSLATGGSFP